MTSCFLQCSLVFPERNHLIKDHSDEECLISDEQKLNNLEEDEDFHIYRCIISLPRIRRGLSKLKRRACDVCTSKACRKCVRCTCLSIFTIIFVIAITLFVALPLVFKISIGLQRSLIFHPVTQPSFMYYTIPRSHERGYCKEEYSNTHVIVNKKNHISLGVWNITCSELSTKNFSKPTLMIFHNEDGDRARYTDGYRALRNYFNVITFDYRSYGDSSVAELNEKGLVEDSVSLYKWLLNNNSNADLFVMGEKLGAAIATHVVSKLKDENIFPPGLILINPFTSLSDQIQEWFWPLGKIMWWMPWYDSMITEPLQQNDLAFNTNKYITQIDGPIMITRWYRNKLAKDVALAASNRDTTSEGMVSIYETWWNLRDDNNYYRLDFSGFIEDCMNFKKNKGNI
ncbi:hypothetical protein FQR65_LT01311 [Abscondita terminalis]|nr:hypothetical protein FQR65_LT01311 [Abscondita terminalis]